MLSLSFIKEIEKIIGRENVLTGEAGSPELRV